MRSLASPTRPTDGARGMETLRESERPCDSSVSGFGGATSAEEMERVARGEGDETDRRNGGASSAIDATTVGAGGVAPEELR
jgi:hypothetical protein